MDKNKKLIIVLPVLLAISVSVWMSNSRSPASKSQKAGNPAMNEQEFPTKKELIALLSAAATTKNMDDNRMAWGARNPFDFSSFEKKAVAKKVVVTDGSGKKEISLYRLSGIFWNEVKPSAIINDAVVGVDAVVDFATVKEIRKDRVILNDGNKDIVLMSKAGD